MLYFATHNVLACQRPLPRLAARLLTVPKCRYWSDDIPVSHPELRIEGTVCLVSDGTSVLIAQITEQIGDSSLEFANEDLNTGQDLPVFDSSSQRNQDDVETKKTFDYSKRVISTSCISKEKSPSRQSSIMYNKEKEERNNYKCPFCPKKYRFKHNLKDHINIHSGRKPHVCKHCGQAFTHLSNLCAHTKRKHSKGPLTEFRCHICKDVFSAENILKDHIGRYHPSKERKGITNVILPSKDLKKEEYSVEQELATEMTQAKPKITGTDKNLSNRINESHDTMADIQSDSFTNSTHMSQPLIIKPDLGLSHLPLSQTPGMILPDIPSHLPPSSLFQASLTDFQQQLAMGIGSQTSLPLSMGVSSMFPALSSLPFPFPSPSPTRSQAPGLPEYPKVSIPTGVLPTSSITMTTQSSYGDFHRTEEGKFQCPYCEKSYNFKHTLKDHINKHTGKRPHVCKHCGDSFTHLASLCNHIKRRHEEKIPEEFQCDICHERFMNYQSVKQHYTWRHKTEKFPKRFSYTGGSLSKRTLTGGSHYTPESPGFDQGSTPGSAASIPTEQDMIDDLTEGLTLHSDTHISVSMPTVTSTSATTLPSSEWPNRYMFLPGVYPGHDEEIEKIRQAHLSNHSNPEVKAENSQTFPNESSDGGFTRKFEHQRKTSECDMQGELEFDLTPGTDVVEDSETSRNVMNYFDMVDIKTEQGHYKYKCKVCGNLFKIRNSLHEHVNSHLGRKPHVCSYCGDSFTHHSTLHNHVKNKHTFQTREEKEASFRHRCVICQRKFRYPSEIERHLKTNPGHELVTIETP